MPTLDQFVFAAGIIQFGILIASAHVPFVLDWRKELSGLSPFVRRLFWVYGVFIALAIVGFASTSVLYPAELAQGHGLGRAVSILIGGFWTGRLLVQFFVFDARPVLKTAYLRCGYQALTIAFLYLSAVFFAASTKGML